MSLVEGIVASGWESKQLSGLRKRLKVMGTKKELLWEEEMVAVRTASHGVKTMTKNGG
jgi:hypothetical protein